MGVRSNPELAIFRVRANSTPVTHNIFGSIPNKGTFPIANTIAGITISSNPASGNKVVYGSISFDGLDIQEGDFLYAADVVRRIVSVSSKQLILSYPLPSTVSAIALKVVKPGRFRAMTVRNTGTGSSILQEATLEEDGVEVNENDMGLAPISYDVSTAGNELTFQLSE